MTVLTAVKPMTEAELQRHVLRVAADYGWHISEREWSRREAEVASLHLPAEHLPGLAFHPRFSVGSETGWPDLVLVRRRDRRLLFVELKKDTGKLSHRQALVLDLLRSLEWDPLAGWSHSKPFELGPRIDVYVWRPEDLASGAIDEALR